MGCIFFGHPVYYFHYLSSKTKIISLFQSIFRNNEEYQVYIPNEKIAIQASFDMNETETWEREISALVALHKVFPLQRAQIVTRDTELQTERSGLAILYGNGCWTLDLYGIMYSSIQIVQFFLLKTSALQMQRS